MEFFRYLNVLKKRLPLIVLLTLLGAGSAYVFSERQPKIYKATATLLINPAAPSTLIPYLGSALSGAGGVAPVDQLANTYAIYLQTPSFDTLVIHKLHLRVAPEALGGQISSALIGGTNYFQISVTWGSPREAARIATGIAHLFVRENARQQAAAQSQSSRVNPQVAQALAYFSHQIGILQRRYNRLIANLHSKLSDVTAAGDRLQSLQDTYFKLLATIGSNAPSSSTDTATPSQDAVAPHFPISPRISRNVLAGFFAGLLLGLALAFLLDFLDYSAHTPEDIEQLVGQAPLGIVGVIGVDSPREARGLFGRFRRARPPALPAAVPVMANGHANGAGGYANGHANGSGTGATAAAGIPATVLTPQLVTLNHPKAPITEAFRTLRTNIEFSSLDTALKSLVVTSSVPGEGKSTVSANLAVSMAQAGKRVILVDADLRRPSLARIFGLRPATGFTTVLLNREDRARAIDEALQPTTVPNLLVMTSGPHPPNPAELLASQSATEVLRELEARSDLVILDTPPMGPLTDAVVLSARVSGTLLIVRANTTRRTVVTNSINTVKKVGGNVIGTVLNMVDLKAISNYSYYYYYRSDYYYGRDEVAATGKPASRAGQPS